MGDDPSFEEHPYWGIALISIALLALSGALFMVRDWWTDPLSVTTSTDWSQITFQPADDDGNIINNPTDELKMYTAQYIHQDRDVVDIVSSSPQIQLIWDSTFDIPFKCASIRANHVVQPITLQSGVAVTFHAPPEEDPNDPYKTRVQCSRDGDLWDRGSHGTVLVTKTLTAPADGWEYRQQVTDNLLSLTMTSYTALPTTWTPDATATTDEYWALRKFEDTPSWTTDRPLAQMHITVEPWMVSSDGRESRLLFIDTDAVSSQERLAWSSALIAGLALGMLPVGLGRIRRTRNNRRQAQERTTT
ncbi:hypothetical protein ICW40_05705 [Actinotalea ferrariae]|uniref:hypothetical protein n=1 Tax=Actinotalea ferrariae TaxID=1386098 RepID=UPI001C8BD018|nr:hypothetical protein [Actinotalea ferrariae]MBX9244301.1 hypothetical protein [Actinotalea ferrariae]